MIIKERERDGFFVSLLVMPRRPCAGKNNGTPAEKMKRGG
jgi:hypothetical protein